MSTRYPIRRYLLSIISIVSIICHHCYDYYYYHNDNTYTSYLPFIHGIEGKRFEIKIMCLSIRSGAFVTNDDNNNNNNENNNNTLFLDKTNKDEEDEDRNHNNISDNNMEENNHVLLDDDITTATTNTTDDIIIIIDNERKTISEKISLWKNETTEKAKRLFLDRITFASTLLLNSESDNIMIQKKTSSHNNDYRVLGEGEEKEKEEKERNYNYDGLHDEEWLDEHGNDDDITLQSDLLRPGRSFHIVTTAAIPWFTGTSVNPLLRAAYLCRLAKKINQDATALEHSNNETESLPNKVNVTLVIPWLELEEDRMELYGEKYNFTSPEEQEAYIRSWLREEAEMPEEADEINGLQILFYASRYHSGLKSIFAMGDVVSLIVDEDADVCILEEPEHLNWYRAPGDGWTKKFNYVVGIIHTNYVEYASSHYSGLWTAPAIRVMSSAMVRAYCHVVIKLSDTLQIFAEEKERVSNVHGVRSEFLKEGERRSVENFDWLQNSNSHNETQTDVYFIGKLLWTKGLDGLLDMQKYFKRYTGNYFPIDIYGNGPDQRAIQKAFLGRGQVVKNDSKYEDRSDSNSYDDDLIVSYNNTETYEQSIEQNLQKGSVLSHHVAKISKQIQATTQTIKSTTESLDLELPQSFHEYRRTPIPATFPGRVDHATLKQYKVFINPSLSEVLCTTTAEALAMGKFVIIPVHPSNRFFMQFPNCLAYRNKLEFAASLSWALGHNPEPLTPEQRRLFTWEAATERLVQASAITRREAKERQKLGTSRLDERIAWFHNEMGNGAKGDLLRKVLGAGPAANQVKYTKQQSLDNREEDDDEGLSIKFVRSSLADALRKTFSNGIFVPSGTLSG